MDYFTYRWTNIGKGHIIYLFRIIDFLSDDTVLIGMLDLARRLDPTEVCVSNIYH